ncbi:MAG TPA: DUF4382 domain-containing protein [Gallionella sp.]|nr:DUF4382 domain-containing protein [Gallionella sp.]
MKNIVNYPKSKPLIWLGASVLIALVAGCGSGSGNGTGSGTLGVSLTDAPACGFDHVYVTVDKVRVHQSSSAIGTDAGWSDITLNPARKIDLLSLNNGALDNLGQTPLPAGHYTQLRLVLDPNTSGGLANSVVPTGGTESSLITPSAVQSGIKLINQFDVASGQRVDLMLDFNACKSIVTMGNGNYALKPVIKVIPFALNGIDGFVDKALFGSNVMVTAQQNGVVVQSTAPNATTGEFFLARVPVGDYDVVITADNHATAVIAAVPVATTTSTTVVSTSGVAITLPSSSTTTHIISGTITLSPPSSTVVAYAAAQQAVSSVQAVTVESQAANDLGIYSLTLLPIAEPLFGLYSVTLPITLTAQSGVAGIYTDNASASGYTTQSLAEDISTTDATAQDFTLVP